MKYRKITAFVLAAAMTAGSSMAAFAADANGAEGEGTLIPHLDKEITAVTLPTDTAVATVFDYYVDPEALIKASGKLSDDTAITGNDDGVYFTNTGGTYSSSSDEVKFEGKNSVDVNVTVTAALDTTGDHSKDIALVADEEALEASTAPALLMTLKVGDNTKVITTEGAAEQAQIAGVPDNFEVTVDGGSYKYAPKTTIEASTWKSTAIQLKGKTNNKEVPAGMTVPKIMLTWSVDRAANGSWDDEGTLWLGKDADTGFSKTGLTVEVSDGGVTYKTLASDKYTVDENGWISITWDQIVAGLGADPTGTVYVRITDGATKYIYQ